MSSLAAAALSTLALLGVVTCSGGVLEPAPTPAAAVPTVAPVESRPSPPSSALPAVSVASAPPSGSEGGAQRPPAEAPPAPLARFHAALRRLPEARVPVRVVWLGDSHTQADFLTHAVRRALQQATRNGGPGYVGLGLEHYRHAGVKLTVEGQWNREPPRPTSHQRQGDGVYGLSGRRASPASSDARVTLELLPGAVEGPAVAELWVRAPRAKFQVRVDGATRSIDGTSGAAVPGSPLRHVRLELGATSKVELTQFVGAAELFGVSVESRRPGLVLDTLGINGARLTTALAWDASAFEAELRARQPALLVLAYGTNDILASTPVEQYRAQYAALLERARRASPELDCLLVGPTDLGVDAEHSHPRGQEIDQLVESVAQEQSCAFFSILRAMGGEGGMGRWMKETPPLAQPDRVHLTPRGYERVGELIARLLLRGFPGE